MIAKFDKRKKKIFKPTFSFLILIILILAISGFLFVSNWKIYQKRVELKAKNEALKKEIKVLEEKIHQLQFEIGQMGTKDYFEKVAKENLNLKNPGEEVVAIIKEKAPEQEIKEEEKGFWQKIWQRLGF